MNESNGNRIVRALLRAGKTEPKMDTTKAELGFETRLMATIRERRAVDGSPWFVWHRVVWGFVPIITIITLALGIVWWSGSTSDSSSFALLGDPLGLEVVLTDYLGGSL